MKKPVTKPRFETNTPQLSETTLTRIRGAARQYVRAGGTIFLSEHPSDHDNHIGNLVQELHGDVGGVFEQALEDAAFSHVEDRGRLSDLAGVYVAVHTDAAFLFGAFVGLELAALTVGQVQIAAQSNTAKRKRGAR